MRPTVERMAEALAKLRQRWPNRQPKAFYLTADDWAEFMATNPPTVCVPWGNNPVIRREDPAFEGVPVRESSAKSSRLYDLTTTGHPLPERGRSGK